MELKVNNERTVFVADTTKLGIFHVKKKTLGCTLSLVLLHTISIRITKYSPTMYAATSFFLVVVALVALVNGFSPKSARFSPSTRLNESKFHNPVISSLSVTPPFTHCFPSRYSFPSFFLLPVTFPVLFVPSTSTSFNLAIPSVSFFLRIITSTANVLPFLPYDVLHPYIP